MPPLRLPCATLHDACRDSCYLRASDIDAEHISLYRNLLEPSSLGAKHDGAKPCHGVRPASKSYTCLTLLTQDTLLLCASAHDNQAASLRRGRYRWPAMRPPAARSPQPLLTAAVGSQPGHHPPLLPRWRPVEQSGAEARILIRTALGRAAIGREVCHATLRETT